MVKALGVWVEKKFFNTISAWLLLYELAPFLMVISTLLSKCVASSLALPALKALAMLSNPCAKACACITNKPTKSIKLYNFFKIIFSDLRPICEYHAKTALVAHL